MELRDEGTLYEIIAEPGFAKSNIMVTASKCRYGAEKEGTFDA